MPVRSAKEADIPQILSLLATGEGGLLPRSSEEITELLPNFMVYDYHGTGEVVGTAGCKPHGNRDEIISVTVHPDFRDNGLGKELVEAAEKFARTGTIFLRTQCPEFFASLGYRFHSEENNFGIVKSIMTK